MELLPLRLPDWLPVGLFADVPDTVWAALVSAVVTLALASRTRGRRPPAAGASPEAAGGCDFLIDGTALAPLNGPARQMVAGLGSRDQSFRQLVGQLETDCCRIAAEMEALVRHGTAFRRHCTRKDGTAFEVIGRPDGRAALLTIRPATAEARERAEMEAALERIRRDNDFLREALDHAPVLAWTLTAERCVSWANAACRERFDLPESALATGQHGNAFGHAPESLPLTVITEGESRRRVKLAAPDREEPHWFDLSTRQTGAGETLCYALDADALVAAEASLARFVETLTETFAHLPIGLAVFDSNRRLGLFNPALADLVRIEPAWLARRPSLRDFLERLRETRQMPEQKNFIAFRRMLTELEEGARDGSYEENWMLPSGRIFRVTGRPHPQGALAFLFEDISPAIDLERRFRAELELSQATLDCLSEAVAVFDTSGMLVFVNAAFEALWGFKPMEGLEGPAIGEVAPLWESRCAASSLWTDLRAFATGAADRTGWTGTVMTLDGRPLRMSVAPLPAGSTLVTFREHVARAEPQDGRGMPGAIRPAARVEPPALAGRGPRRSQGL